MNALRCECSWMAEAVDDGRLSDEQRTAFAQHSEHCLRCRRAAAEVSRLRDLLSRLPEPALGDFQHHRQRQQLLARVAGHDPRRAGRWRTGRRLALAGVLILAGAGIAAVRHPGQHASTAAAGAPKYEVTGLANATWTNEENGATARVRLTGGSVAFHVHRLASGQRFLAALPDGEIEVRGTRFVVDVEDGRTRYVVVIEGKVAVRHRDGGERLLLAGERWDLTSPALQSPVRTPPPTLAPAAPVQTGARKVASPIVTPSPSVTAPHPATVVRRQPPLPAEAPPASTPPVAAPEARNQPPQAERLSAASDLFARGIQAFRAGNYRQADNLWQAFATNSPRDPRVEDAAFLRVVGRSRLGDASGAASLARDYLN